MPWKTELPMEQRERFVILAQSDRYTKKELCEHFGISRKTGHKWLKLNNVARASLEELLLDFQDYLLDKQIARLEKRFSRKRRPQRAHV